MIPTFYDTKALCKKVIKNHGIMKENNTKFKKLCRSITKSNGFV